MTAIIRHAAALSFTVMILASSCAAPTAVGPPPGSSPGKPRAPASVTRKAVPGRKTRKVMALGQEVRSLLNKSTEQTAAKTVKRATELTELLPDHPYPWVLLGLSGISARDLKLAENGFSRALILDPENVSALLGLGDVARYTGKVPIAVKLYRKAFMVSGESLAADRLAQLEISLGRYDTANTVLASAFLGHPENDRIRNNLAVTLDLAGNRAQALEMLDGNLSHEPDLLRTRAMIHLKEGHPQTAAGDLEASLSEKDADRDGRMLLGILNLQRGELEAAEAIFSEVISFYPDYPDGYLNLGFVKRRMGKFTDTALIYNKGIELAESADLHLNLGVLKELYLGSPADAVVHYRKFVQLRGAGADRVSSWISYLESISEKPAAKEDPGR